MLFQIALFHSFLWLSNIPLYMCVCVRAHACMLSPFSRVWLVATLWIITCKLLCPWDSPGKNTGIGCYALLQGISIQISNPHLLYLLHYRQILYCWATQKVHVCMNVYIYIYTIFYIHSSFDGHLGCIHVLATVNKAAVNMGYMTRSGLLDYRATLFLVFWVTSILFSIVVIWTCIPTSHVGGFPFLHMLFSMLFLDFLRMTILTGVRWYLCSFSFALRDTNFNLNDNLVIWLNSSTYIHPLSDLGI